jgi:hypothetical protein
MGRNQMMQLVKYRIAMYVNIIGWRLVGHISESIVNVNNWCTQEEVAE